MSSLFGEGGEVYFMAFCVPGSNNYGTLAGSGHVVIIVVAGSGQ